MKRRLALTGLGVTPWLLTACARPPVATHWYELRSPPPGPVPAARVRLVARIIARKPRKRHPHPVARQPDAIERHILIDIVEPGIGKQAGTARADQRVAGKHAGEIGL